jgi:hypothetical protein
MPAETSSPIPAALHQLTHPCDLPEVAAADPKEIAEAMKERGLRSSRAPADAGGLQMSLRRRRPWWKGTQDNSLWA